MRQFLMGLAHFSLVLDRMKFMRFYLIGYFVLLFGAGLALWQSGILQQIPGIWLVIGLIVAVGLGILLAASSASPVVTTRE